MIRDNQILLNRIRVIGDGLLVAVSYLLAWYIRFESGLFHDPKGTGVLPMEVYFSALYVLIPGYLILYAMFHLNAPRRGTKIRYEFAAIIEANVVGVILFIVTLYVLNEPDFSRNMIALFFGLNVVFTGLSRIFLRIFLRYIRKKGYNLKHILMVGYSRSTEAFISRIEEAPQFGYAIAGILDDEVPVDTKYHGVRVIGKLDELQSLLEQNRYDEAAIALPLDRYDHLEELVAICEKSGIRTKFIPDYTSLFPGNPYTEDLMGLPIINVRYVPLTNTYNRFFKRFMDIIGAIVAIILFSPFMLASAIAVKCSSKGPVIFKQERIGRFGKPFMMYKFRSMELQTEEDEEKAWTKKDDPRVTKAGRFLRRTSLDETPQFFNILKGDMSLVGPRPERPSFVEKFKEEIPRYMIKHQVRPGLTGWAQINGYRGDTSIRKRIEYDIYYIENWSVLFDLRILVGTFGHGFINKNAY
ncbi:MAG: undecaprenyl-phosphate glucose phosphotransferase [Lachnospiraceae bacterium]|nr:undecaprenyl-phosphate glucose phosphotransferase [Lachnospiraceae bacterium]